MAKNLEPSKLTTEALVALAIERKAAVRLAELQLAEIEAALIARGPGKHSDAAGNTLTVVEAAGASVKYGALSGEDADAAKEIAGAAFAELFERTVTITPKSGFVDRADALLNAAPKAKLFALCGKPTAARKAYLTGYPKT